MEGLTQHKNNLDTLATRLAPLEDQETGVQSILSKVKSTGNLLTAKIACLDDDAEMSLVTQVEQLTGSKNLLEQRVSVLVEEFAKLDSVHEEISTLYSTLNQAQRRTRELDPNLRIVS
jgi:chaperonin cofactor prefoldin